MAESLPIPFTEPGSPPGTFLLLFFSTVPIKNEKESQHGAPVFENANQVRIVVPGSIGDSGPIYELERFCVDGSVKRDERAYARFREPYEVWKKGQTPSDAGTPLEQWPGIDVAMVATFKAVNVFTVQQLAALSDCAIETVMRRGGREWRAKAQAWLDQAKTAAGDAEARATIARQQEQIDELNSQVRQLLQKQNQTTLGYDKPKRGRAKIEAENIQVEMPEEEEVARL